MNSNISFDDFASQLRAFITRTQDLNPGDNQSDDEFNRLASALFSLQAASVPVYGKLCARRKISSIQDWREIPALPASAFKEYEVTSLRADERTRVFHSSGTTQQKPSRHFHNPDSLAIYEASLLPWFQQHFLNSLFTIHHSQFLFLTPSPTLAPHSSLAHMLETIGKNSAHSRFTGQLDPQGAWALDMNQTVAALNEAQSARQPIALLGTAFSFVHLLDHCQASQTRYRLPAGSRVMETGGYKGRSRVVSKLALRQLITRWLGIPESHILAEYGMSELSSQAYDRAIPAGTNLETTPTQVSDPLAPRSGERGSFDPSGAVSRCALPGASGAFHFPPWARVQIISPETGREVGEGETGMVRVFDLANIRSVMALQTEDLAVRRGNGFELIGREAEAEPRGCSLMLQ